VWTHRKRHSDLLGGKQIQGATLVAVCDHVRARTDAIASKFGISANYDIGEFLARPDNLPACRVAETLDYFTA
jgi:UDP-N-acetyl-2-amino-2-deoxyglucuronate dehydrogenase